MTDTYDLLDGHTLEIHNPRRIVDVSRNHESLVGQPGLTITYAGAPGVPGPPGAPGTGGGGSSTPEILDSAVPPAPGYPTPYLRIERDGDGDVQAIYLGTAT